MTTKTVYMVRSSARLLVILALVGGSVSAQRGAPIQQQLVFTPYHGRDALRVILEAVMAVFEDFHYVREIGADIETGARDHALVFEARVGDKQIEGCDFIQLDDDGAISAFTVMVRPMSGMLALAEAMKAQLSSA